MVTLSHLTHECAGKRYLKHRKHALLLESVPLLARDVMQLFFSFPLNVHFRKRQAVIVVVTAADDPPTTLGNSMVLSSFPGGICNRICAVRIHAFVYVERLLIVRRRLLFTMHVRIYGCLSARPRYAHFAICPSTE